MESPAKLARNLRLSFSLLACWNELHARFKPATGADEANDAAGLASNYSAIFVLAHLLGRHLDGLGPISIESLLKELKRPWSRQKLDRLVRRLASNEGIPLVIDAQAGSRRERAIAISPEAVERFRSRVMPTIHDRIIDHAASSVDKNPRPETSARIRSRAPLPHPLDDTEIRAFLELVAGIERSWQEVIAPEEYLARLERTRDRDDPLEHAKILTSGRAIVVCKVLVSRYLYREVPISLLELHTRCAFDGSANSLLAVIRLLGPEGRGLVANDRPGRGQRNRISATADLVSAFLGTVEPRTATLVYEFFEHLIERKPR